MKYLAMIALLAAVCVALSCRPCPEQAERVEGQTETMSSAEGASGTGGKALASPGTTTAPSEVRPMSPSTSLRAVSLSNGWWLAAFLAAGIAVVLYLLDWLRGREGG